jgi:hypothetical protein
MQIHWRLSVWNRQMRHDCLPQKKYVLNQHLYLLLVVTYYVMPTACYTRLLISRGLVEAYVFSTCKNHHTAAARLRDVRWVAVPQSFITTVSLTTEEQRADDRVSPVSLLLCIICSWQKRDIWTSIVWFSSFSFPHVITLERFDWTYCITRQFIFLYLPCTLDNARPVAMIMHTFFQFSIQTGLYLYE